MRAASKSMGLYPGHRACRPESTYSPRAQRPRTRRCYHCLASASGAVPSPPSSPCRTQVAQNALSMRMRSVSEQATGRQGHRRLLRILIKCARACRPIVATPGHHTERGWLQRLLLLLQLGLLLSHHPEFVYTTVCCSHNVEQRSRDRAGMRERFRSETGPRSRFA